MNSKVLLAYCAFPNEEAAKTIANLTVSESIVACANVLGPMTSIYKWNGQLMNESEWLVFFKTTELKRATLKERIRATHPYAIPGLVFLEVTDGLPDYLKWVYTQSL